MGGHDVEDIHELDVGEGCPAHISAVVEEWHSEAPPSYHRSPTRPPIDQWLAGESSRPTLALRPPHETIGAKSTEPWIPKTGGVNFAYATDDHGAATAKSDGNSLDQTEALFVKLADEWRTASLLVSSVDRIVMHPAYQRIIGLGPIVIPLILRELRRQPDLWFWALNALTGEDVAAGEETVDGAARRWIEWGAKQGHIE